MLDMMSLPVIIAYCDTKQTMQTCKSHCKFYSSFIIICFDATPVLGCANLRFASPHCANSDIQHNDTVDDSTILFTLKLFFTPFAIVLLEVSLCWCANGTVRTFECANRARWYNFLEVRNACSKQSWCANRTVSTASRVDCQILFAIQSHLVGIIANTVVQFVM